MKQTVSIFAPDINVASKSSAIQLWLNRKNQFFSSVLEEGVSNGSPDKPGGLSIQLCKSEKKEFYIRYSS